MSHPAIRDYLRAAVGHDPVGAADADLLGRFAAARDESAFELLVWRHAALVQRVCRAVLRDRHAAEDAAQATFLVLARKAHTFAGRGSVVGWLYRVARRVSIRLARGQVRNPGASAELDRMPAAVPEPGLAPDEAAAVCAEVDRLPERYRVPVLLCFFEGLTHAEAARRTGWPVGTVAGRLARAKDLLARRLGRKGVGLGAVALTMPAGGFVGGTARAATLFADRAPILTGVEPSAIHLAEGALHAMTASTWKLTAAAATVLCALTAGVWGVAAPQAQPPAKPQPAAALKPAPGAPVADAKQRARSQNNLKQILIALHNFHDANNRFPGDITDKDGRPILSWRVAILPYLEQDELYKSFKLDEPWDSDHNKKLLDKLPEIYRTGTEGKNATKTYYQGLAGTSTVFEPGKKVRIFDIPDGTSNTIAVVESGPAVEWTKPADIPYDPKKPLVQMDGPFANVLFAGICDGSVMAFKREIDETTLRRLIERDDGQVIALDDAFAKFPLTKEEIKDAQEVLKQNEKLLLALAEQLREQQKLLAELAKKSDPVKGLDLERLARMQAELEEGLAQLKKQTEELRQQAGKK